MLALLENFQESDGSIAVPPVLFEVRHVDSPSNGPLKIKPDNS
jgi:hypothetical protein